MGVLKYSQELFLSGWKTTSSTIEWALTKLLRRHESMNRTNAELS